MEIGDWRLENEGNWQRYVILESFGAACSNSRSTNRFAMQVKALSLLCAYLALGLVNASPLQKRNGTCQKTKVAILLVPWTHSIGIGAEHLPTVVQVQQG